MLGIGGDPAAVAAAAMALTAAEGEAWMEDLPLEGEIFPRERLHRHQWHYHRRRQVPYPRWRSGTKCLKECELIMQEPKWQAI
jgi:hypothetical protein